MRTLLLSIALTLCIVGAQSQASLNPVRVQPKHGQGFLILEGDYPNVDYWQIQILRRNYSGSSTQDITVERHELWNTHYLKIPPQYMVDLPTHEFMFTVTGKARGNSTPVVDTDPLPLTGDGTPWWLRGWWICDGVDYAWAIQQLEHQDGYRYKLSSTGDYVNENGVSIPFYLFMEDGEFDLAILNSSFRTYHDLGLTDGPPKILPMQGVELSDDIYDRDGLPLTGNVTGVQKTGGPWKDITGQHITTPTLSLSWIDAMYSTDFAAVAFNSYADIQDYVDEDIIADLLECDWSFVAENFYHDGLDQSWSNDCFDQLGNLGDYDQDSDNDLYDVLFGYLDCFDQPGPGEWNSLSIIDQKESGPETVFTFNKPEIIGLNGTPSLPSIALNPGLYQVVVVLRNGKVLYLYIDNKTRMVSDAPLSVYLDATIFPVPIIGDQFSVNLQTAANLNVKYDVLDGNGVLLHSVKFKLTQGHDENHFISPVQPIPEGVVLHRFTFDDNSVKIIPTVK